MATVPHGVRSGEQFPVLVNNQQLMVTCPPGVRPGMQVYMHSKKLPYMHFTITGPNHGSDLTPRHQLSRLIDRKLPPAVEIMYLYGMQTE
jgi:hypothetical protein